MMSEERIAEIRRDLAELLAPWRLSEGRWGDDVIVDAEQDEVIACTYLTRSGGPEVRDIGIGQWIAHAPTLVAELLDEIERLRWIFQRQVNRYETQDSGTGWPKNAGPLAWAMCSDAREALRGESRQA